MSLVSNPPSVGATHRRVARAALAGSAIEYYEFGVYGLLAPVIAPQFFPQYDQTAALLATFLLFAVAFVIRPLGGLVLARFGDAAGRRNVLMATVIGTGAATAAIGLLPTYAAVGVAAPVMLLVCRLAQGFFTGGEAVGAATYVSESVPSSRRGFFGAFTPTGIAIGLGAAALVSSIVSSVLTDEQMSAWGWRIPFVFSAGLVVSAVLIRRTLDESLEFEALKAEGGIVQRPVAEVLHRHRGGLLRVLVVGYAQNVGYWVGITFMSTFLVSYEGYSQSTVLWIVTGMTVATGLTMPAWGALSDRVGRRPVLAVGLAGYAVLAYPMMLMMTLNNVWLAGVALFVLALPFPLVQAVGYPTYAEQFPTEIRYTGLALSYNAATILGGGLSPYLATWLIATTGWHLSPALLMIAACGLGFVTLRWITDVKR